MRILGIDTSTACGGIGLIHDERIISDYLLNVSVTHSERLLSGVDFVLRKAGYALEDLDGLAISLGPGSFTGVRIGVSTVKGLAFAVKKPVVGVSTLDVLASQVSPTPYLICPIIDAKKGETYSAFYRYEDLDRPKRLSEYQVLRPEVLSRMVNEPTIFLGDGVKTYGDHLRTWLKSFAIFSPPTFHIPHGSAVARLGIELLLRGETLDLAAFIPLYVRRSEAEIKWDETHPD
ncbi:MAG: tRNA (adenosine(37)-N6)-threonylcarbamoyltransferase complex dimerization subunit type 1 TsaB [Thermodesulfobacteriota bacterium]